jgi:hypothetical protein
MSSVVSDAADFTRMFSCSTPKYIESAPACIAACKLSHDPTGAIISIFISAKKSRKHMVLLSAGG